jgi:exonuclease VII large subunit
MENNLAKSLTDLIDETLAEIEALKKSDRFAPEEIEMGHDADGSVHTEHVAAKAEDDEEEKDDRDEEEDEEEAEKAEKAYWKAEEECEKAEHALKEAMKKRDMCKAECDKHMEKKEHDEAHKAEGVNALSKAEKKEKKIKKMEKKLAKSLDERVAPIENQIAQVLEAVKKLADSPVPARGATYKHVQPLAKSVSEESLSKSQVLNELITLKKSGREVAIEDVLKAEIGGAGELQDIANKYGIK